MGPDRNQSDTWRRGRRRRGRRSRPRDLDDGSLDKRVVLAALEFEVLAATLVLAALLGIVSTAVGLDSSAGLFREVELVVSVVSFLVSALFCYAIVSPRSASREQDGSEPLAGRLLVRSSNATLGWTLARVAPLVLIALLGLWFPAVGAVAAGGCLGIALRMTQLARRAIRKQAYDGLVSVRLVETGFPPTRARRFSVPPARLTAS